METSMARLSSGKRINSASDDAAGVAISSRLSAEIRGTDQAIRNALDGQALIDTAEGAHSEIENILQRMREVSVQAANDTNNNQDRANLQAEMSALVTEIDRIAGTTTWAGEKLMEAESGTDFSFQVGAKTGDKNQIDITINGMGAHALGLQADSRDVIHTVADVAVGISQNTQNTSAASGPALNVYQASISAGVVTPNHGNDFITLLDLGVNPPPAALAVDNTTVATKSAITLTDAALANGFKISLYGTTDVDIPAGSTGDEAKAIIDAGAGNPVSNGSTQDPASMNGHGVTAAFDSVTNVMTLTMNGAITGGSGSGAGTSGTVTQSTAGASIASANTAITMAPAPLSDVTYDSTDPSDVNDAVDKINNATSRSNITATVGAAGSVDSNGNSNEGKIILTHAAAGDILIDGSTHSTATGIGTHASLSTVLVDYDIDNSDPAAIMVANGNDGILTFDPNAGTAFSLTLALDTTTGVAGTDSKFTIDTTDNLQKAVDLINDGNTGSAGSNKGSIEHGYTASIHAVSGSAVAGTIKLTKNVANTGPASGMTQISFAELDLGAIGHSTTKVSAPDGTFAAMTLDDGTLSETIGIFTPNAVNTTGTVSLTLGTEAVTVSGISTRGDDVAADATAIVAEINSGTSGYTAEAMKDENGVNTGAVKITANLPAADMDVTDAGKARDSIVAIDDAIKTVNIQRSKLGAVSNRLSHTINNLTNISSNLSAAQGGIEDADFAHETTMLAKNQILQQASTAMLAQANASKQNVLSLLQG
jgi:flagellin